MSNFKSQAKRKRELAKLDKRQAKEQKRAVRKAEQRSAADLGALALAPATAAAAQPMPANHRLALATAPVPKPSTLAEAVERWKNTKVVKPKKR